jgi:hypothetical protein
MTTNAGTMPRRVAAGVTATYLLDLSRRAPLTPEVIDTRPRANHTRPPNPETNGDPHARLRHPPSARRRRRP